MADSRLSALKYFRSFRLSLAEKDPVQLEMAILDQNGSKGLSEQGLQNFQLVNLSLSGLAFETDQVIELDLKVKALVTIKKQQFRFDGVLVRAVRHHEKSGYLIYGVKLNKSNDENSRQFLECLIQSFSSNRLKKELVNLLVKDVTLDLPTLNDSMAVMQSLYTDLKYYEDEKSFIKIFMEQARRYLNVENMTIYLFEAGSRDKLNLLFSDYTDIDGRDLSYDSSLIEQVQSTKRIKSHKFSQSLCDDPFYKNREESLKIKVKNVLISPLFNNQGDIVGVVDYINKKSGSEFDLVDKLLARFLSFITVSLLEQFEQAPVFERIKFEAPNQPRKYALIGESEHIREVRAFIQKMKNYNGHILLSGEVGIGKELLARVLHTEGPNGKMPYGILDSRDMPAADELTEFLCGGEEAVGKLDLYAGGSLILKGLEFLSHEQQNIIGSIMSRRSDIRYFFTYSCSDADLQMNLSLEFALKLGIGSDKVAPKFHLRPLRERKEDISALVRIFLKKECDQRGLMTKSISREVMQNLMSYEWPENTRELKRAVERIVLYYQGQHLIHELPSMILPIYDRYQLQRKSYAQVIKNFNGTREDIQSAIEDFEEMYQALESFKIVS